MAVRVTKSGGIIIQISGDNAKLLASLREAQNISKAMGKSISDTLGSSLSPSQAAKSANSLNKYLVNAAASAKAAKADLSNLEAEFAKMGRAIGVAGKDLSNYVSLQSKMYTNQSVKSFESNLRAIQRVTGLTKDEMNQLAKSIGGTGKEFGKVSSEMERVAKSSNIMGTAVKTALAYFSVTAAKNTLTDIAKVSTQFDSYQRSFNAIAGGPIGGASEMEFIRSEANRLGQDIFALADAYRGLSAASMSSGLSQAQVRDIFSAVGEASTTLGLSSDQTKYALYALQQMMSKGVVSMEELRRQLGDALPGAFQAAARAMNMTEMELIKMVESGRLMSVDFLPKFAAEIRNTFGAGFTEAAGAAFREFTRLGNAMKEAKNEIGANGFLQGLSESAKDISASLGSADMRNSLQDLGSFIGNLAGGLGNATLFAVDHHKQILALGAAFLAISKIKTSADTSVIASEQGVIASIRSRIAAEQQAAAAVTATAVATAKANLDSAMLVQAQAAWKVRQIDQIAVHTIGTKNEERAVAMLTAQRLKLATTDQAVAVAETNLARAQAAASKSAIAGATAMGTLRAAGSSVLGLFGGPLGLAITAAGAGIFALSTMESQAEKTARDYGMTLEDVAQIYADLKKKTDEATNSVAGIASEFVNAQKAFSSEIELKINEANIKKAWEDIQNNLTLNVGGTRLSKEVHSIRKEFSSTNEEVQNFYERYKNIVNSLNDGTISAEEAAESMRVLQADMKKLAGQGAVSGAAKNDLLTLIDLTNSASTGIAVLYKIMSSGANIKFGANLTPLQKDIQAYTAGMLKKYNDDMGAISAQFEKTDEGRIAAAEAILKSAQERTERYADIMTPSMLEKSRAVIRGLKEDLKRLQPKPLETATAAMDDYLKKMQDSSIKRIAAETEATRKLREKQEKQQAQADKRSVALAKKAAREAEKQQREMISGLQERLNFYENLKEVMPQAGAEYDKIRVQLAALQDQEYSALGISQQFIDKFREWEDLRNATDAVSGLRVAMQDYVGGLTDAKVAADIFNLATDGVTDMITDTITFTKSASQAFGDMATSMVNSLARIAVEMMVVKPIVEGLTQSFSGLTGGGGGGGFLGSIGGWIGGLLGGGLGGSNAFSAGLGGAGSGTFQMLADGGIFNAEGLHKYVNSVVNRPTIFPFAKGVGLMGEAGAEAIMPLKRNSKGQLGVSVDSDGQGMAAASPNISINIINQSGQNLSGQQGAMRQDENGNMSLDVIIKSVESKIRGNMAMGTSPIGHGIEEQYGLKSSKAMNKLRKG